MHFFPVKHVYFCSHSTHFAFYFVLQLLLFLFVFLQVEVGAAGHRQLLD